APQGGLELHCFCSRIAAALGRIPRRKSPMLICLDSAPDGFARQLIAIQAAPSRVLKLRRVRAPTLVLHGSHDPLAPLAGGEDTAANIAGAGLRVVPGMGHFLPEAVVPFLVNEIAAHC